MQFASAQNSFDLIGEIEFTKLKSHPDWATRFDSIYRFYEPDASIMQHLKTHKNVIREVILVVGTWCSDSYEQVPKMYKIFNEMNMDLDIITIVGANRDKSEPSATLKKHGIVKLPTLLMDFNGRWEKVMEETPSSTIEAAIDHSMHKK